MSGLTGFLVMLCMLQYTDAAIRFTGPGPVTGTSPQVIAAASVAETSTAGDVLFAFNSTEGGPSNYAFAPDGNPGSVAVLDGKNVKLAASKSIDFDTMTPKTLVFKIIGNEAGGTAVTLTVTLTITNRLEFANTSYEVCVAEGSVAGTMIETYTATDSDADVDVVTYSNAPDSDLKVDQLTGELKVATGKTLTSANTCGYTTTIIAENWASEDKTASAHGRTVVKVTICSGAGQVQFMAILLLIPLLITRVF